LFRLFCWIEKSPREREGKRGKSTACPAPGGRGGGKRGRRKPLLTRGDARGKKGGREWSLDTCASCTSVGEKKRKGGDLNNNHLIKGKGRIRTDGSGGRGKKKDRVNHRHQSDPFPVLGKKGKKEKKFGWASSREGQDPHRGKKERDRPPLSPSLRGEKRKRSSRSTSPYLKG